MISKECKRLAKWTFPCSAVTMPMLSKTTARTAWKRTPVVSPFLVGETSTSLVPVVTPDAASASCGLALSKWFKFKTAGAEVV